MVDIWQAARQVAEQLLATATWSDPPNALVLAGGAFVSEDWEGEFLPGSPIGGTPRDLPFARVQVGPVEGDNEAPGRGIATLRVFVVAGASGVAGAAGTNDTHGIDQETGANRDAVQGQGKSTGRSTDEIVARLLEVLGDSGAPGVLTEATHGLQGRFVHMGERIPVDGVQVLIRSFDLEVYVTLTRTYPPVRRLAGTYAGGGVVNLSWVNPGTRFDTLSTVVRRGTNPGDAAPSSPTGGTAVGLTSSTTAQATGLVTGQTYNFSVFPSLAEAAAAKQAGTADRYGLAASVAVQT